MRAAQRILGSLTVVTALTMGTASAQAVNGTYTGTIEGDVLRIKLGRSETVVQFRRQA